VNRDPVTIRSIGAVTPLGRNLQEIADALDHPPPNPQPILRVQENDLADPAKNRQLRRADRFIRMAALAALDAGAGMAMDDVGLIITTGFGPHCRGFKFLDGILDCGDAAALPTDFSHSVHGAAASYIAGLLDLRGPTLTATDFEIGFEQAVLLAQCWLSQGICKSVLVGAVEELGDVMIHCASRMLNLSESFALGEGAVFLALTLGHSEGIAHLNSAELAAEVDLLIVDPQPTVPQIPSKHTATFSRHFGQSASIAAFQLLGGLLTHQPFDTAATLRTSCNGAAASLLLRRT
jgi:hypothetical protein